MKSKYDAILVQMVGYDTNCDGKVDQLDTNGDGVIDSMILPIPTSQIPQGRMAKVCQSMPIKLSAAVMISATGYDTNSDGAIDSLDTNADGKINSRIVPQAVGDEEVAGGRGKAAPMPVQKQHRDKDGTLIAVGYGTNMDGKVDCTPTAMGTSTQGLSGSTRMASQRGSTACCCGSLHSAPLKSNWSA